MEPLILSLSYSSFLHGASEDLMKNNDRCKAASTRREGENAVPTVLIDGQIMRKDIQDTL